MFQTKDELKLILVAGMHIAGVEIADPHVVEWARQIRGQMQPADVDLLITFAPGHVCAPGTWTPGLKVAA